MSEIRVGAKHALETDFAHSFLVFVDDQGDRFVTSLDSSRGSATNLRWEITQINTPAEQSNEFNDKYKPEDLVERTLDLGGRDPEDVWSIITQVARNFQSEDLPYEVLKTNSNAFLSAVLHAVGLDYINTLPYFLPNVPEPIVVRNKNLPIDNWFDGSVDATGPKFTGIFGLTSAQLDVDIRFAPDRHINAEFQPLEGISEFDFGFSVNGTPAGDIIRGESGSDTFFTTPWMAG